MKAQKVGCATSKSWNGERLLAALRARGAGGTINRVWDHLFCMSWSSVILLHPIPTHKHKHTEPAFSLLGKGCPGLLITDVCSFKDQNSKHVRVHMGPPSLPKHDILSLIRPSTDHSASLSWALFSVLGRLWFSWKLCAFSSQLLKYLVSVPAFHNFPISPWLSDSLWSFHEGTACSSNPCICKGQKTS